MSDLKIFKHLDWVTMTWRGREFPETVLPMHKGFDLMDEAKGGAFYQKAWRLACGGIYAVSEDERQGIMLMLPGQPLKYLRETGFSDRNIIDLCCSARNVSRMDYAVNMIGGTLKDHSVVSIHEAAKEGRIKTRLGLSLSYKDETSLEGGESLYFGSPQSEQRVIVYDKAQQQKRLLEAWTRVEMRLKNKFAKTLANDMSQHGVVVAGDSKLVALWNADVNWFQDILSSDRIEPGEVPDTPSNFPNFLRKTVMPSIKKNLQDHRETVEQFVREIQDLLD